ncbi:MAG: corrinoid protein [Candidatus Neomarinimicrobiota bacterium]
MTAILSQISHFLIQGDREKVLELTRQALDKRVSPEEILDNGLIGGMTVVGERFKRREIFLPDVLLAARAMSAATDELKPLLVDQEIPTRGKVVLGTVRGDLHDIGKNLVGIMLRGAGFQVIDLGKDISPERFVDAAVTEEATVIGMSALLTTTMPVMKGITHLVEEKGLRGRIKVIVGGAPTSEEFAREIGADAYAYDATKAVECIQHLIKN